MARMEQLRLSSFGARLASIPFAFMTVILMSTYTANLAAVLTVNQINSQVHSIYDLKGKAVSTNDIYQDRLRVRYGIVSTQLAYNSIQDMIDAGKEVGDGLLAALISDAPILQYALSSLDWCDTSLLPAEVEPFSYGLAFKMGTADVIIDSFSGECTQFLRPTGHDLHNIVLVFPRNCVTLCVVYGQGVSC